MKVDFRPYHRHFKHPLDTSHGLWKVRDGIILRLTDETGIGFGEIAPLSWFGSESFKQALEFCRQLPAEIDLEMLFSISTELPACQFGFESAWADLAQAGMKEQPSLAHSALLPTGEAALQAWQDLWHQGYQVLKWKVGVAPLQDEIAVFKRLLQALPTTIKLRLDANGGLSYQEACEWLKVCDQCEPRIEFLEQPLSLTEFDAMCRLSTQYSTPLALDESVATLRQLKDCYQRGWRGIFVIKPAIAGFPSQLRQFCRTHNINVVFSSVFETAIGRQAGLKLAAELCPNRAVGFGVGHWFDDQLEQPATFEQLWQSL